LTKQEIKILDTIWSFAVKERDGLKCRYTDCNQTKYLNSHHIVKRQFKSLRWDIDNGITLCVGHHTFGQDAAHVDEIGFLKWLKSEDVNYDLLHETRNESNKNNFAEQLEKIKYQSFQLNLHESLKMVSKYEGKDLTVTKRKKSSHKLSGIKTLREKNGISREDIARLLGVKDHIWDKIEDGKKSVTSAKIKKIAIIFKVKPNELYE
jgi:DNA-binding transcriptional regulator YiaG